MKRIALLVAMLSTLFAVASSPALAVEFVIPLDTVVRAPEGSITELTVADTPPELIGNTCVGVAEAENQESVHPGNNLIIASGGTQAILYDVERAPNATTPASGEVTLGPTVTVSLQMGPDEVFSAGLVIIIGVNCTPPTTTTSSTTTTTTEPPTTTTAPEEPMPQIIIEKTANPVEYGEDNIADFIIKVTNPGPVDLTQVRVTDDIALSVDPNSDCPNPNVPDLAVGESYEYECSVANMDGVSPWENEATAIGVGPNEKEVTDTDTAIVTPPVLNTSITATTEAPGETLPVTGVPFERVRGSAFAGIAFFIGGIALLGGAALIGRLREER